MFNFHSLCLKIEDDFTFPIQSSLNFVSITLETRTTILVSIFQVLFPSTKTSPPLSVWLIPMSTLNSAQETLSLGHWCWQFPVSIDNITRHISGIFKIAPFGGAFRSGTTEPNRTNISRMILQITHILSKNLEIHQHFIRMSQKILLNCECYLSSYFGKLFVNKQDSLSLLDKPVRTFCFTPNSELLMHNI